MFAGWVYRRVPFSLPVAWLWRSRNLLGGPAVLVAVLTLLSCQASSGASAPSSRASAPPSGASVLPSPSGNGVITGGITGCSPRMANYTPHYVAGTVTVFKGQVTTTGVVPTTAVAQESVGMNATYRFVVDPGQYVLQAQLSSPSDVAIYTSAISVTVRSGDDLRVDIPPDITCM